MGYFVMMLRAWPHIDFKFCFLVSIAFPSNKHRRKVDDVEMTEMQTVLYILDIDVHTYLSFIPVCYLKHWISRVNWCELISVCFYSDP